MEYIPKIVQEHKKNKTIPIKRRLAQCGTVSPKHFTESSEVCSLFTTCRLKGHSHHIQTFWKNYQGTKSKSEDAHGKIKVTFNNQLNGHLIVIAHGILKGERVHIYVFLTKIQPHKKVKRIQFLKDFLWRKVWNQQIFSVLNIQFTNLSSWHTCNIVYPPVTPLAVTYCRGPRAHHWQVHQLAVL